LFVAGPLDSAEDKAQPRGLNFNFVAKKLSVLLASGTWETQIEPVPG